MNKSELARELGISRQMLYKLIAQGMPIDSLQSSKHWRNQYLDPIRRKEYRIGLNTARRKAGLC